LNTLADLLGVELPIIQAPMAGVQDTALALAVAAAGGLGSLPAAMLDPAGLEDALTTLSRHTDLPININFFCHTPIAVQPDIPEAWQNRLAPYYSEYGVTVAQTKGSRAPFGQELAEVIVRHAPRVVSFHFGLPEQDLLDRILATGAKVLSSATSVAEALWLEQRGVSAIIAQGYEAGGHRGMFLSNDLSSQLGTFALLPQVVAAVRIPVIAAGGIADAAGVAAACRLGASGVQVGTSFLRTPEATTSEIHRRALADLSAPTAVTNVFSGRPARGIVNRAIRELGPISDLAPPFPTAGNALQPLRRAAEAQGNGDFSPLWSGQNRSGCSAEPAADIVARLAEGLQM
jgi:nitronate monooxygenase